MWHFYYWNDCLEFIRQRYENDVRVFSISPKKFSALPSSEERENITQTISTDFEHADFNSKLNCCFIVGEKCGLSSEQINICDELLHIEFPGMNEDQEKYISYEAKISLCLQRFCRVKNYAVRGKACDKEKHVVEVADKEHVKTIRYAQISLKKADYLKNLDTLTISQVDNDTDDPVDVNVHDLFEIASS